MKEETRTCDVGCCEHQAGYVGQYRTGEIVDMCERCFNAYFLYMEMEGLKPSLVCSACGVEKSLEVMTFNAIVKEIQGTNEDSMTEEILRDEDRKTFICFDCSRNRYIPDTVIIFPGGGAIRRRYLPEK